MSDQNLPWKELFFKAAIAANCLPSTFVDANEHVIKAIEQAARATPAAQARDAVIEECAKVIDQFANGATDDSTQFALDICSDAVRALKSAPPEKPAGDVSDI
jgi:hypothetical protein